LSYAVMQISVKDPASFLAARFATEISATKKQKQKRGAAGSPFLVTFLAKQKSESRRGAPFIGTRSEGAGTVQRVAATNEVMNGTPMTAPAPRRCPPWRGHHPRHGYFVL
jgi:hypothetical protein